jgi:phytoene dehydrogenase-like protein
MGCVCIDQGTNVSTFDVISVGSGHNGLIAAAYLAKAGKKVLVLEKNDWFGGGVVTSELVAPGFQHDWHSATHIVIQANPLIRNDELGLVSKYGLKYVHPESVFSTIFDDHSSIVSYTDLDKTCESIARISPRDAEAYRRFAAKSAQILPLIVSGMFVPPPPQGPFWALLDQSAEGRELMRNMQMSMLDIVREWFTDERVMVHLLKFAAEMLVGPDIKGTGAILYNMPGFVHAYPPGVPMGGSAALVKSLMACLKAHGAEFRSGAEVEKVLVKSGRATGVRLKGGETFQAKNAVIGQIHPWLLGDVVEGLDAAVTTGAKNTKTAGFSIMTQHYALNEPPKYHAGEEPGRAALQNFAPSSLEKYMRIFDDFAYGDMGTDHAMLAAHVNSQFDPTRAPPGKATLSIFAFGPYELRGGGAAAWNERKEEIGLWVRRHYAHYVSNLTDDNVVAWSFHTPLEMVADSPTFQRGDVGGVGKYFYQIGGHRPTPALSQYAVPGAEGLYLAGTFMHPPGGITGGGRATAVKMCGDLGIDFDKLVKP